MKINDLLKEKRRFPRFQRTIPVTVKIIGKKEREISSSISLDTKDISQGGMMLSWPKGWKCGECTHCLAWIYNRDCNLRKTGNGDGKSVHPIPLNTYLKIDIIPFEIGGMRSHIVWVGSPEKENGHYPIGISLLETLKA